MPQAPSQGSNAQTTQPYASASISKPGLFSYLAGWSQRNGLGSSSEVDEVVGRYGARGKVIFVTGATSPIAQALCTSLYRHGATVVLGCRGPSSRGEELATTLHTAALQQQQRQRCAAPSNSSSPASNGHAQQELATGSSHKAGGTPGSASDMSTASQADNILANTTVGANHKGAAALEAGVTAAAESTPQKAANAITGAQSEGGAGTTFIPSGEGGGSGRAETQDSMGRLLHVPCDFSCLDGAKACADAYEALGLPLHILINCVSTISPAFKLTPDNMEEHFGVNHLAPFLLTARLLPLMARSACGSPPTHQFDSGSSGSGSSSCGSSGFDARKASCQSPEPPAQHVMSPPADEGLARVVWVSCSAHYITYLPSRGAGRHAAWWPVQGPGAGYAYLSPQAYGLSKAAAILGSRELANRAAAAGLPIAAFSVHPGVTTDGLKRYGGYSSDTWAHRMKAALADGMAAMKALKSHSQAAASIAYAALAPELVAPAPALPHASAASQQKPAPAGPPLELALKSGAAAAPSPSQLWQQESTVGATTAAKTDAASGAAAAAAPNTANADIPSLIRMPRAPSHAYCEDCSISKPSPAACDDELACTLWELSESLTASHLADALYMECLYPQGIR